MAKVLFGSLRRRNQVYKILANCREFFSFFLFYLFIKAKRTLVVLRFVVRLAFALPEEIKSQITAKLIWGRGRLIRPFISLGVGVFLFVVFLTGGLFQYKFVTASFQDQDFVSGVGYIVPERITATTVLPSGRVRDAEIEYEIKSGDTLSSIGQEFGVTTETLRYANSITNPNSLTVGQKISIPPVSGAIHTVVSGDTVSSLSTKYQVASQAIADFNYLNEPFILATGQKLIIPDAKIPVPIAVRAAPTVTTNYDGSAYVTIPYAGSGREGDGDFIWPTRYHTITQYFSWYHPGLDIGVVSPIYASDAGTVIRSGWWANGYGFAIQIDHGNGFVTTYAHMSKLYASVGDEVEQGEEIGMMGSTGRSTGPHTHFTIQYYGSFKNPLDYL